MHPAQKFIKPVSTLPQHGEINIAPLTAGTHAEVDAAMRISVHPCRIGAAALKLMHLCRLQCTLPENATARVDIVAIW